MAFKMKGFPMRSAFTKNSGFKHADQSGAHSEKDHTHVEASEEEEVIEKKPESKYQDFDIEREISSVNRQKTAMDNWMTEYKKTGVDEFNQFDNVQNSINRMNKKLEQLHSGDLTGYERLMP